MTDLLLDPFAILWLIFCIGAILLVAGALAVLIRRREEELTIPTPAAATPAPITPDRPVAPNYIPASVVGRIPPYLPPLDEMLADDPVLTEALRHRVAQQMRADPPPDDDEVCDEIILVPALREVAGPTPAEVDALAERLRAATLGPVAGPVCPACGGPFGACACVGKVADDDDPLTSTTIRIDTTIDLPVLAATRRGDTVELSSRMAKILEAQR